MRDRALGGQLLVVGEHLRRKSQQYTLWGDVAVDCGAIRRKMSEHMESESTRGKRKSEGEPDGDEALSPHRRGGSPLTVEMITALLAKQTREIQEGTSRQIHEAVKNLEEKTLKRIDKVEEKVDKMVKGQDGKIEDIRQKTEAMLERIQRLEERPPSAYAGSSTTAGEDRRALVVGGWKADTHRDLILADFKSLLQELELGKLLDGEFFVPGLKHNVVIVPILLRDRETEQEARQRMTKVVQIVREARLQTQNLPDNSSVWAAISKPRAARQLASHAGKVRKCLYLLDINARNSECEYSTGSVWLNDTLLASAVKQPPKRDTVLQGKLANSWVDAQAIAHAVPCAVKRVEDAWQQCMAS